MATIKDYYHDDSIEIEEFFNKCDAHSITCSDDLEYIMPFLGRLSNNRHFLSDYLCDYLKSYAQIDNPHSLLPTAFIPHFGTDYVFRVIIWPCEKGIIRRGQYSFYHNHDINFLTCGYAGSGYVTELFEYDFNKYSNNIDEVVTMKFDKLSRLKIGRVVKYEAGRDVHTQHFPETLSVSINLVQRQRQLHVPECVFRQLNESQFEITGHAISIAARDALFHAAAAFGGEDCKDVLVEIAKKHPYMRVRACIWHALMQYDKSNYDEYYHMSQKDPQRHVRKFTESQLRYR